MNKYVLLVLISLFAIAKISNAEPYTLPLQLDYGLIKKAVVSQLFKGEGGGAEVWHDKHKCSFVKLFNPRISGEDGQIKLLNDVQAQFGKGFAGQCIPILAWAGALETLQKPTVSADHSVLSLPVTKANAYDQNGRQINVDKVLNLLKKAAEPKLANLKVDLNKSRPDMERELSHYVPPEKVGDVKKVLSTLQFSEAEVNADGVKVKLAFDAPVAKAGAKPEAPFTAAEQKQWQAVWKEWDGFLSKTINKAASETKSSELRNTLKEILMQSRGAFKSGLTAQRPGSADPVRVFFTQSWQKLAPQLKTLAKDLPEAQSLRYLMFIAATDVLYELENLGAPFGLSISSDGLRRLGRMVIADKQKDGTK